MKTSPEMIGELIDWFGNGVTFTDEKEDSVTATVNVNLKAMRFWALQYAPYVTIISPQSLMDKVKQDLRKAIEKYKRSNIYDKNRTTKPAVCRMGTKGIWWKEL